MALPSEGLSRLPPNRLTLTSLRNLVKPSENQKEKYYIRAKPLKPYKQAPRSDKT